MIQSWRLDLPPRSTTIVGRGGDCKGSVSHQRCEIHNNRTEINTAEDMDMKT